MHTIQFTATLPDIISAISLPGSDDLGARIKLDISPADLPAVVALKTYGAGHVLRVTIEVSETDLVSDPDGRVKKMLNEIVRGKDYE